MAPHWRAKLAEFTGIFNGNGFAIRNLSIHKEGQSGLGLFGAITGTVRNLTLGGVSVAGYDQVAALAGMCAGTVEHCILRNAELCGRNQIGGLIGYSSGSITGCSVLDSTNCGYGSAVGGLVGATAEGDFTISDCAISDGDTSGFSDTGGLIGFKECSVYVLDCKVSDSRVTIDAQGSTQPVYCGRLIGQAREFYLLDPSESEDQYARAVTGNEISADVLVSAIGTNAFANQYNPYTGVLEPVEW